MSPLGSVPVQIDALSIDTIYTESQKVLGVPTGLAHISFSDKALWFNCGTVDYTNNFLGIVAEM